jgi:hypothetical protein
MSIWSSSAGIGTGKIGGSLSGQRSARAACGAVTDPGRLAACVSNHRALHAISEQLPTLWR